MPLLATVALATLLITLAVAAAAWKGGKVVLSVGRNVEGAVTALSIRVMEMEQTQAAVVQCVESLNDMAADVYGSDAEEEEEEEEEDGDDDEEDGEDDSGAPSSSAGRTAAERHPLATSTPRASESTRTEPTPLAAASVLNFQPAGATENRKYLLFPLGRRNKKRSPRRTESIRMKTIAPKPTNPEDDADEADETLKKTQK